MNMMTSARSLPHLPCGRMAWQGCALSLASRRSAEMGAVPLRGELRRNESMREHVSWRAGGAADRAYVPADIEDLAAFLQSRPAAEDLCFVGLGSNLLVRDGGFRGTVVFLHGALKTMRLEADGAIYAEAGVASPKIARFAAMHDLDGAEFLAGIPGTVGGALAMNAGCYGAETWDRVEKVRTIDRRGTLRMRAPADYEIGYRYVRLQHGTEEWFAAAWLRFAPGDARASRRRIKDFLMRRIASQPVQVPNAGSVFRNPPGDHAARLIEACGLKGFAIGGARVSEKHANFIVNPGGRASAADIEALIERVRDTVNTRYGVDLVPEVRIVGEKVSGS
jgi:UDP-N-acetylmuramate dehydrogenase